MLQQITSLQTETIVLLVAMVLLFINVAVAAFRSEDWLKLGKKALAMQNLSSAIHYLSKEILTHPRNVKAYLARARAYRLNGESEKALADESTAQKLMEKISKKLKRKADPSFSSPFHNYSSSNPHASLG